MDLPIKNGGSFHSYDPSPNDHQKTPQADSNLGALVQRRLGPTRTAAHNEGPALSDGLAQRRTVGLGKMAGLIMFDLKRCGLKLVKDGWFMW